MGKPSLHEIAAMPYPASVMAMREHYNAAWGLPLPDEKYDEPRLFKVRIDYSFTTQGQRSYTVEALSEEEAEEMAVNQFDSDLQVETDAEIDLVHAKLASNA
ncbi:MULTISPECIES: hypothetical protein [unclassified Sphingomonas]|uniref:hypothetical protein n=1 Tax=unclassified Sphingomonas TaxID=196159 RepID=UPI0006F1DD82|nr:MULTISPECIES: hypothetical protein [unclassified Sphingomonas]KQM62395.1 hypothetical protein ASE65_05260 [Sphingomonas sp. Leaf16]KQN13798.1 hypothetical protein ASE81_05330 [Sphingomonas sp. Leaf29]